MDILATILAAVYLIVTLSAEVFFVVWLLRKCGKVLVKIFFGAIGVLLLIGVIIAAVESLQIIIYLLPAIIIIAIIVLKFKARR